MGELIPRPNCTLKEVIIAALVFLAATVQVLSFEKVGRGGSPSESEQECVLLALAVAQTYVTAYEV